MTNTSFPHKTYTPALPAINSTSSYASETSWIAKLSQPWNFLSPLITPGETFTGFAEALSDMTATRAVSDESYILSEIDDEPAQYRIDELCPESYSTDLQDFERSEFEDWKFYMVQFYHVLEAQREGHCSEDELCKANLINDSRMLQIEEGLYKRLLDEALLEDLERYEEEEEEFWVMRGVAQTYGMWDDEYWQGCHIRWWNSTRHLEPRGIEVNATIQAEYARDIKELVDEDRDINRQIREAFWWSQMREHYEGGIPGIISWQELPGRPDQPIKPWKTINEELSKPMFEATEYQEPGDSDSDSSGSECGQNSVYQELPEEDPDWVKLDEEEHAAPPPPLPPSPIVEPYFIDIPKISEPKMVRDEAWTLIVSSQ
ncbi:hypothetical protein L873DRAFT_1740873 [Choiromyces venosus 120613-1]|uniref:Uncharacterized protein n=1 Tax=Choiromyces venosus 120613-1 TaxID=1336337 RepID=A0A3N4JIS4_9PEZI|nr:hypothetical protein L873DRAFT_1740873 [Choiromyces venosus 120613-1]